MKQIKCVEDIEDWTPVFSEKKVWSKDRGLKVIWHECTIDDYRKFVPDAIEIFNIPGLQTLERYAYFGQSKAVDGCSVNPGEYCQHGFPCWLRVVGMNSAFKD